MSWKAHNGVLRFPQHPGGTINGPLWIGAGADAGKFSFIFNYKRVISAQFGFSYVCDGVIMSPVYKFQSGHIIVKQLSLT